MRFIHTADWHIGKTIAPQRYGLEFSKSRRQELLKMAENIVNFANQNQVDLVLCAGDLFHSNQVHLDELKSLNQILSKLERAKFIVAAGNHDPLIKNNNYDRISWCEQVIIAPEGFSEIEFPELNCTVHTYSWTQAEESRHILENWRPKKKSRYDIMLLHGDVLTTPTKYLPISPIWLRSLPMDYIALGHIHQAVVLDEKIRYSGSPEPLDISEDGEHGFWLCELDIDNFSAKKIAFAQRKCIKKQIEISPQVSSWQLKDIILKMAEKDGKKNLYDIEIIGQHSAEQPLNIENLRQDLLVESVICQIFDKTVPDYDLTKLLKENEGNLIGGFIRSFPEKNLSKEEKLALEIGLAALLQEKRR